ncbi:LuxR C-terminal-related transcriptional regulator [Streptomyces sp. NPDC012421]|uniref:LuxR C-terminal-related transcriptional regulator n=1 Tax=Streptomyces sp. NPDC012421 TaxID=3364832 RepID=UPI0036EA72CC
MLGRLGRLGFDHLAAAVYRGLIGGSSKSVDDLAKELALPAGEVRSAIERLEKMDLLLPQREGRSRLVDPNLGLKSLLLRQIAGIEDRIREFEEDRATVLDLLAQFADRHPGGMEAGGVYVSGREAVTDRLWQLAGDVEAEWLAFVPGGVRNTEWLELAAALTVQVHNREVANRTVYTDGIRTDAAALRRATRCKELGCPVRTVPSLPVHMLLIDRSRVLLPVDPGDPWYAVMEITSPGVIAALQALFEHVWESGVPLGTDTGTDEHGLSPQERELVRLLSRGLTDGAVSRRLGVSLRTVRRVVADLSTRLGAESRFEMGFKAAERGWL